MLNLIHGDCLEVMKTFDNECIDLTVTSPPYDNLRTYNGFTFDFENIAKELYRITKPGGVIVWIVGDATINGSETGTSFRQALYFKDIGFNLHDTMIYKKLNVPPSVNFLHHRYEQEFEFMFILSKGKPKTFNCIRVPKIYQDKREKANGHRKKDGSFTTLTFSKNTDKVKRNIWEYVTSGGNSDKIASKHPATFPEKLAQDHIISWSNEGDTVLDCFMGSGTTGKIAKQLNRNFIGIEISQEYLDIATARINA